MVTKRYTKEKKVDKRFALTGVGEFTIPVTYKWTCEFGRVILTTKNRYQGIASMEIPVKDLRDMLRQIDSIEATIPPLSGEIK